MDLPTIEVWFCKKFPRSESYAQELTKGLEAHFGSSPRISVVDVEQQWPRWNGYGLMSLPAVVLLKDGQPVSNIVAYAPPHSVLDRVQKVLAGSDLRGLKPLTRTAPAGLSQIPFAVIGSSGCHRYLRWHEDLLSNDEETSGWCGPNRKDGHDFLLLEPYARCTIKELWYTPRRRTDGTDSYRSFPAAVEMQLLDSDGRVLHSASYSHEQLADDNYVVRFQPDICVAQIRIKVLEKCDIDGKSFPSIAGVKLFGAYVDNERRRFSVKPAKYRDVVSSDTFLKFGIYSNGSVQYEQFVFKQGQKLPSSICLADRVLHLVRGRGCALVDGHPIRLEEGDAVVVRGGAPLSVEANLGADLQALVLHTNAQMPTLWESR